METSVNNPAVNLRHLRAVREVAMCKSISKASEVLFLSQPAITQAIAKIEGSLGVSLFDRRSGGVFVSEVGKVFVSRIDRALQLIEEGAQEAVKLSDKSRSSAGFRDFSHLLTTVQLKALNAVSRAGNFSLAARMEGITQPSLHRAARDIERLSGIQFYRKTKEGIEVTPAAAALARSAKLAFAELQQGYAEIAEWLGRDSGLLVIGALPLARASVLPYAINQLTLKYPAVKFRIVDGPYDTLLRDLRHGDLDFLIGALRYPVPVDDVLQERLFDDTLSIVVRPHHPLTQIEKPTITDLAKYPWILPREGTPARDGFVAMCERQNFSEPEGLVEASSFILVRNLLMESDRVTMISAFQVQQELRLGLLAEIPFNIADINREIGITIRRNWRPTAMQGRFLGHIRNAISVN